ncbi:MULTISPECIES: hypothetical protein [Nocardiopsidaceae]|uniref:Uncharacterized protein n=1 Tax=Marinactinospora rubrisoli TaxID=2715399 RepID=A0ABW2KNG7_9ACTN|nr:hypothetical protein [Marinitenerispora sediminis]
MSLLDSGAELVEIYPQVLTTDDLGNEVWAPADDPVVIRCSIQPVTSDELSAVGQDLVTTYRLIARTAPLGPWARVRWVNNANTWWDVIGTPRRYGMSPRTAHVDALLRQRKDPQDPPDEGGSDGAGVSRRGPDRGARGAARSG